MSDKKGNTGVVIAVVAVAAVLGVTIYLLSRKSKSIDQTVMNAGSVYGGTNTAGMGVVENTGLGAGNAITSGTGNNANINSQLGIGVNPKSGPKNGGNDTLGGQEGGSPKQA